MKTKKYKTLAGLMKALRTRQWTVLDMNRGEAWFPSEGKTCKFELPIEVIEQFYWGCAKEVWVRPKEWQVNRLKDVTQGIFRRLWCDENGRYTYCAGQDYPGEIRCMQNIINKM